MKSFHFAVVLFAFALLSSAFGQDDRPLPASPDQLHIIHARASMYRDAEQVLPPVAFTLPNYSYSIVSPVDGKTYAGQILGANPTTRPAHPVVIPEVIIPVRLVFQFSATVSYIFDPTAGDPGCIGGGRTALGLTEQSPLFNDATYKLGSITVGNTQYIDAFMRGNFWGDVSATGANYHILMGITPMPLQTVTIASGGAGTTNGAVFNFSGLCGTNTGNVNPPGDLGVVNISDWDPIARNIITNLGISPNTFVFFLFYNAVMSEGPPTTTLSNCCIAGYHDINGTQTYGTGEFEGRNQTLFTGAADTSVLAHEHGEWINDPTGANPTPAWGNIGQVVGCQSNYEVGDPLSGTLMPAVKMPNGFTYHLQELAFFDWFYRITPSIGVNGHYSLNGTFTTDAGAVCN